MSESPTLTLNYFILGDNPNRIAPVKIEAEKDVIALREDIWAKENSRFDAPASALQLWAVSILGDETFDESIEELNLQPPPLPLLKRLSNVFRDPLDPEHVHIIVKPPPPKFIDLNCCFLGYRSDSTFVVHIEAAKSVHALAEAIRSQARGDSEFAAIDIQLWKLLVPVGEDDVESVKKYDLADKKPLSLLGELSEVFPDPPPRTHVHIVAKPPPKLATLNCFLECDPGFIFPVEIGATQSVDALREAIQIWVKNFPRFGTIDAHTLRLWVVSVPIDRDSIERIGKLNLPDEECLKPSGKLSELFLVPLPGHIHVVVKPPPAGLGAHRAKYIGMVQAEIPSVQARSKWFAGLQGDPERAIYCGRPKSASHPTPVTLLHPIFAQFVDECRTYAPTYDDNSFALAMSEAMSDIYPEEGSRIDKALKLFEQYEVPLRGWGIQGTDAGVMHLDPPLAVANIIDEVGTSTTEPYAQAILYYLESTRQRWAPRYPASPLPCLIITIFGPCLSFAGAVWDRRPSVQVLSPVIPFHFHPSDTDLKSMAARQLGAFRNAIRRLEDYYKDIIPKLQDVPALHDKLYPYPTRFTSLVGPREGHDFRYSSRQSDERLVFFGSLLGDNTDICIKFVRHYSPEAHRHLADQELAPRLLGFERLSSGWYMVVMDRVDGIDLYSSLYTHPIPEARRAALYVELRKSLAELHRAGFVHGDIRASNIMIPKKHEVKYMLLDFDWAGEIGTTRYPADVYRGKKLWRPQGVSDGALITADHDVQMLDHIFTVQVPSLPSPTRSQFTSTSSTNSQAGFSQGQSAPSSGSRPRLLKRPSSLGLGGTSKRPRCSTE